LENYFNIKESQTEMGECSRKIFEVIGDLRGIDGDISIGGLSRTNRELYDRLKTNIDDMIGKASEAFELARQMES